MFDIGGWEFLVIVVLAIVIIGPKDLPASVRMVTGLLNRLRGFAREFQSGLDDITREVDLTDVQNQITDGMTSADLSESMNSIKNDLEDAVDADGEITDAFDPAVEILTDEEDDEEAARLQEVAYVAEYDDDDLDEGNDDQDEDRDDGDQVAAETETELEPKTGT